MKKSPEVLKESVQCIVKGRVYWQNKVQNRFYSWDSKKEELDVYNIYGEHLGTLDSEMNRIGKADKRRNMNV